MASRFLLTGMFLVLPGLAFAQSSAAMPEDAAAAGLRTSPANAVLGVWVTPGGKSHVRIGRTDDGTFNGRIIWLKQPTYPADYGNKALAGQPKVDIHNPDKSLRSRPVMGMEVLEHFEYSPDDRDWRNGSCYDPEEGKTYNCRMWLEKDDHGNQVLKVRGYVWIFFKTQTWHRYTRAKPAASSVKAATPTGS